MGIIEVTSRCYRVLFNIERLMLRKTPIDEVSALIAHELADLHYLLHILHDLSEEKRSRRLRTERPDEKETKDNPKPK